MTRLNSNLNHPSELEAMRKNTQRRMEVDLLEVERIIELARQTPGLANYEDELQQLSIFFQMATLNCQQNYPELLSGLFRFWERYRDVVIQRYAAVTPVELRAADKVVKDIFQRFLICVPNEKVAYSADATPLVFGGEGGLNAYFSHPPDWNRPFAIINLPYTAFDNVWQWLALAHETGHDIYATVNGLAIELENAISFRMIAAVRNGTVTIPDINVDLNPFGIPHRIKYSGEEFLLKIWRAWINEVQADIVGLLSCGGAAIVALQQIIGFGAEDTWRILHTQNGMEDAPEVHPTSYIRNALNIAALRLISDGHDTLADEIQARFQALRPDIQHITWSLGSTIEIARVPVEEMVRTAEIAAEVLVSYNFPSLGKKSYRDLGNFTGDDQAIVDTMTELLVRGNPTFAQGDNNGTPRHALAATVFAFEKDITKAALINRTFKNFV